MWMTARNAEGFMSLRAISVIALSVTVAVWSLTMYSVGFTTGSKTKATCPTTQLDLAYSVAKVGPSGDIEALTCVYIEVSAGQPRRRLEIKSNEK